jgi:hypothetical protein
MFDASTVSPLSKVHNWAALMGAADKGHEMVLELVSGAVSICVLHHFSSLTRLKGSWGQVCPENVPKPKLKSIF